MNDESGGFAMMSEGALKHNDDQSNDSASNDDNTTSHNTAVTDDKAAKDESYVVEVTRTETKAVNRSKLLVYLALLCAAAAVGTVTYFLTANEETESFKRDFKNVAAEISKVAESNARKIVGQVQSFSTTVTSIALSYDLTWPNVTVPHFARQAREAEDLTGIELLVFVPIVPHEQKAGWEEYAWQHQGWITESNPDIEAGHICPHIYAYSAEGEEREPSQLEKRVLSDKVENLDIFVPVWQLGPVPSNASVINLDLNTHPSFERTIAAAIETRHVMLSEVVDLEFLLENALLNHALDDHPRSYVLQPIFDGFGNESNVAGFFAAELKYQGFFEDLLDDQTNGILVVVHGTCGEDFTYLINGRDATFLQTGDAHHEKFDDVEQVFDFAKFAQYDGDSNTTFCSFTFSVYPTDVYADPYYTNKPAVYASIVVLIFVMTAAIFALYDYWVYVRQRKLLATAKRTNDIVASMFPKEFQQRIMEEAEEKTSNEKKRLLGQMTSSDANNIDSEDRLKSKPIADLFTDVTISFADIVGFTAWASSREPSHVFILLETIFHEFDTIASRRKVFKVETVGDCYVSVCGLPNPRKDHAVAMARFARDCLHRFNVVTRQLENELGPDTSELGMRCGLHSGSVTAGVLRGDRARFQLFGDAMNTASRIESTGAKNKIHISSETAERLTSHGKGHWCVPREDQVVAKGKGQLSTYWLVIKGESAQSSRSGESSEAEDVVRAATNLSELHGSTVHYPPPDVASTHNVTSTPTPDSSAPFLSERHERLINWNTDILLRILKEVVARREALGTKPDPRIVSRLEAQCQQSQNIVLEEVKDVICLTKFEPVSKEKQMGPEMVELGTAVTQQLREFVATIANVYRDNPFHNFEHASHVTMSAAKLLSRIVSTDTKCSDAKELHNRTYGLTSDPLAQFTIILSALVHDVDHTGVPNSTLVKEQASIAAVYKNRSVAEQNSVEIVLELLMHEQYQDLRRALYVNAEEFQRFRQLLINMVLATDIMDKDLGVARKARWNKAFETSMIGEDDETTMDRRATIVMEHLIQASDVAHTMQHWQIYRKWNARLFEEMYLAYKQGRADTDPSINWFEGEKAFFDFYVIPLAMKLKDCGVFGVSSDEYLDYAQRNRREWEMKGRELVTEMVEEFISSHKN